MEIASKLKSDFFKKINKTEDYNFTPRSRVYLSSKLFIDASDLAQRYLDEIKYNTPDSELDMWELIKFLNTYFYSDNKESQRN